MLQLVLVFFWVVLECSGTVRGDDGGCYTSGSVAGIVIATIVVTLVMGGLAAAFIWYLWKQRKIGYGADKSPEKPIVCPPMSPDKQLIVRESNDYAFDNPYFKDDESENTNLDAAEKGESKFRKDNGNITSSQNSKTSNGTTGQPKKSRPFSSLPFPSVFHPSGKKQQKTTMDDTYITKHLEHITVPLRGHDFTGLGFNICGNMRDGIFVKDVLHRGPASESGKIKAGDRIVSMTVSFGAMVYEDALTILSYASPYDVRLEIEKAPAKLSCHLPPSSPRKLEASTSFKSGKNAQRNLFHPLYRSQSIDDLTQIGKDGFGIVSSNSGSQRDSNPSATPKRSQSVEASNGGSKTRSNFILKSDESKPSEKLSKASRKSSTSSCESSPTEKAAPPLIVEKKEAPCDKTEVKSARFRAEQELVKSEAPSKAPPPTKPQRDVLEEKNQQANGKSAEEQPDKSHAIETKAEAHSSSDQDSETDKPTAPPRKSSTPKRRAPAPPPIVTSNQKEEISAVVHHPEDMNKTNETSEIQISAKEDKSPSPQPADEQNFPPENLLPPESFSTKDDTPAQELPVFSSSTEKMSTDPGLGSSDNSSLASAENPSSSDQSPGKRKASSLGDLTKLERGGNKKASISSAILERAVSLDFQQSLPGENLTKQKKILQTPTFEDDYEEDMEDLTEINGSTGLKRWDGGLDKVLTRLPNGNTTPDDELKEENSVPQYKATVEVNRSEIIHISTGDLVTVNDQQPSTDALTENTDHKTSTDLEDDSPIGELPPPNSDDPTILLTSTPMKRIIEVKDLILDNDDMDDIPYMASAKEDKTEQSSILPVINNNNNNTSATIFSPVTISIPVIKPDLTQFEKLPSPPPASTHPSLEPGWRASKTVISDDANKPSLEKITVQSLYRPIFTNKETTDEVLEAKMVNGNESDASEHYSTAQENTSNSSMETSTLSVTLSTKEVNSKTPNTIAGFAKTLIIPGPNEVENLLSLATEPNTPPPTLESPSSGI